MDPGGGQSTEEPGGGDPVRGTPQVPCSSWCCESGRHQSENGYFTTPGSHRTTVRPPAREEQRFPRAGLVVPHGTPVPWATPKPAAAAVAGPGGLSPRGHCDTGLQATGEQHEGSPAEAKNPSPGQLRRPEGQRLPPPCSATPQERGFRHEGGTVDPARGRAGRGGGASLLQPVSVGRARARLGAALTPPPSAPPALLLHWPRRHYPPRRAPASLCERLVAGRRRWRGLDEASRDGSVNDRRGDGRGRVAREGGGGLRRMGGRGAVPEAGETPVMPQLRSGKVVTASEVKSADGMVTSPSSLGAGVGREPGKKLLVKQSPHLAPKRKPEQPLSSCLQPAMLPSSSCEQFAPLVPMQKVQAKEKWKAIERDAGTQAVKKLKTNRNRSEASKEKEPHYSKSLMVATSGKNSHEAQTISVWRKNSTKLLAFEDGFKKTSELSVTAKGENSDSVAHHSAASDSLRVLAEVHDVSNCHRSKTDEKLKKVHKKIQQFTCQRAVPMTGKNVWPFNSCARTSERVRKNHGSISEEKRLLRAAFKESSDKSSVKAAADSAVTRNLRQLDLHTSSVEVNKESTHKIIDPNTECLTSLETPESSSVDIYETPRKSNENAELPLNMDRSAMALNHDDVQEVKATLNFTTKQKDKGAVMKRNLSVTVQNGTSTSNRNRINFSREASVVNQTSSDLKLMKLLNTGNLTKFKIPLCRNKPESRKLESVRSFERKSCSPLELLDSTSVSRRQKTGEETFLVNSKQQPLPVVSDAMSTASMRKKADEINSKDFQHGSSENFSNEMSALPEHFSLYPHPFLDGQLESSVPDFRGTECVLKSHFPDDSWNAVDHPVALEINDDSKSRGNLSQHKSQNFPDILEAYKEDVLVIDVIQDDPDLFGTNNKEELAPADCESCPVKASGTSTCIKDEKQDLKPEYPVTTENGDSVEDNFRCITIQESGMSNDTESCCDWVLKAKDIKTRNSSRGSSPLGGVTEDFLEDGQLRELDELLKSFDMDEKASYSVQRILEMIELPRKYCRFYFTTLRGCERAKCWFWHVPEQGDEKICMAILRAYISINESGLLKRAVQIFVKYYREVTPGVDFVSQVLNDLLISLLKNCLLQEVFQILNVTAQINTLPAVDVLLKVFEHVAALNIRDAVPTLINTFCKLIDAGMFLEFEHFDYIIKFLHQLQVSSQEINTVLNIKSRFQERHFEKNWLFDFNLAVAEIQHCKEKSDWTKLGSLYVYARTGCEHFDDLQKLSLCIVEVLTRDSETDRPGVPFCDFADAVIKNSQHNEADRIFIGRSGISVMYSYHKALQWIKGRKVLDKLHELQIHFTVLKGLIGTERLASRCQIVNKAAEIFLKTGSLNGATWVLRESEWTTNAPSWPCDKMDILSRHNLLSTLVHNYLRKSLYKQAFEVLQNLPGFQNHSDTVDVSHYSCLFNKLINACFESKNLGVSSCAVDFMLSKNIAIDFFLLRGLITALGRSSLWSKARTYYKSALSLGCYPPLQGNLYHKLLTIPSYLSEVEMLLAIEMFLVSNASDIQSPMATSQTLQIILKRCEDQTVQNNSVYQAAVERLILAARLSDPKLFLKHMTMNVNMEEVYSLELTSALKWLQENMKWAGKVWLFQQSIVKTFGF
ncbi:PREDICTED: testis- and ovary-specific PAZ domain-containing protein 1 [Haliaeetus leucocephalus]|uniref:testis- and ovary-specific PAZ domain-containing protein 1 n=1 Tax=Haliaeetus leucocephalus TaxID=52644 RepID=UPI00053CD5D9|nr:PREDICTED: testis- and ovary-specific PAZ domain-containing protein 1 [Haliaeetus leucocephalus]